MFISSSFHSATRLGRTQFARERCKVVNVLDRILTWQENPEDEPARNSNYTGNHRASQIRRSGEGMLSIPIRGFVIHAFYQVPYPERIDLLLMNDRQMGAIKHRGERKIGSPS